MQEVRFTHECDVAITELAPTAHDKRTRCQPQTNQKTHTMTGKGNGKGDNSVKRTHTKEDLQSMEAIRRKSARLAAARNAAAMELAAEEIQIVGRWNALNPTAHYIPHDDDNNNNNNNDNRNEK